MQDLPLQKEIGDRRAGFGKFGMHVEFVRNAGERVQFGGNLGAAQRL